MCSICGFARCPSSCPNSDDPREVCRCIVCKMAIYEGQEYLSIDGDAVCEDCADRRAADVLLALGAEKKDAAVFCDGCGGRITGTYYTLNDKIICADCLSDFGEETLKKDFGALWETAEYVEEFPDREPYWYGY